MLPFNPGSVCDIRAEVVKRHWVVGVVRRELGPYPPIEHAKYGIECIFQAVDRALNTLRSRGEHETKDVIQMSMRNQRLVYVGVDEFGLGLATALGQIGILQRMVRIIEDAREGAEPRA